MFASLLMHSQIAFGAIASGAARIVTMDYIRWLYSVEVLTFELNSAALLLVAVENMVEELGILHLGMVLVLVLQLVLHRECKVLFWAFGDCAVPVSNFSIQCDIVSWCPC